VFALMADLANGDDATLIQIRRERAEAWEAAALAERGLKRLAFLENAIKIAKDLPDLRDRLIVERQKIKLEDLGLQRVEAGASIDKKPFLHWVDHVLGAGDPVEAVHRLIALKAPSGNAEKARERSREVASAGPLAHVMAHTIVSADAVTIRQVNSEDEHEDHELAEYQRMSAQLAADFLIVPVLEQLPVRFPGDTASAVLAAMARGRVSNDGQGVVRDALHAYWEGSMMTCACLLVPLIEQATRNLARLWDRPLLDQDARGYVPLNDTIELLNGRIDESWRQCLNLVLVSPLGFNLRNEIAHGLTMKVSRASCALMVLCFLYLATLSEPDDALQQVPVQRPKRNAAE